MNQYILTDLSTNQIIGDKIEIADSFISRMVGLLKKDNLGTGEGLIITACNSIHMVFMRFAIDVIFIDKRYTVVGLVENIKPYQFSPVFFKANRAIELPAGTIRKNNVQLNSTLKIEPKKA